MKYKLKSKYQSDKVKKRIKTLLKKGATIILIDITKRDKNVS